LIAKEEILRDIETTIAYARRTTASFAPGEWDQRRASGWTPKETYAHLAAVAAAIPTLAQSVLSAGEEQDLGKGLDIDRMNSQSVAAMASMTPEQVMEAFEGNYRKLMDFVRAMPEDQLQVRRSFFSGPVPVSQILASVAVLHAMHHIYEAASRFGAQA
jgi:hypothetical protein